MILETKSVINSSVLLKNSEVKFNEKGQAEVEKEIGEYAISNFPKIYWEEGKRPEPKKEALKKDDSKEVTELKTRIATLERIVEQKDIEISKAKNGEAVWKEQFEIVSKERDSLLQEAPTMKVEKDVGVKEEDEVVIPEGMEDYYNELIGMHYQKVKKFILDEKLGTEEEIKDIKKHKPLVQFALNALTGK